MRPSTSVAGVGFINFSQLGRAMGRSRGLPAGFPRSGSLSSNVEAAAGFAGTAAALAPLGASAAVAEAAPALAAFGPYGAAAAAALALGSLFLGDAFAGKPKLLDTAQAAQRLLRSPFKPLQDLGTYLAIFVKNGVPLSTGEPKLQAQLRSAFHGTVQTILNEYPLAGSLDSVNALLHQAVSSEHGDNATAQLNALLARSALVQNSRAQPAGPRPAAAQPGGPFHAPLVPTNHFQPPAVPPPADVSRIPDAGLQSLVRQAVTQLETSHLARLVECIALAFVPAVGPEGSVICLKELLGEVIYQGGKNIIQAARQYIINLFHLQPNGRRAKQSSKLLTQPSPQPSTVPLVDMSKPCLTCMTPKQRAQWERENQQLKREIETETQQETEQELEQTQSELDTLQELESQPLQSRDIAKELQRKYELQSRLDSLDKPEPHPPVAGQPSPLIESNSQIEQRDLKNQQEQDSLSKPVQFCLGCKSQEDAILFLNGEPSACSVVPGTTKNMDMGGA